MEGSGFKSAAAFATAVGMNLNYFHGRGWGCSDQGSSPCSELGRALQIIFSLALWQQKRLKKLNENLIYRFPDEFKKWRKVGLIV